MAEGRTSRRARFLRLAEGAWVAYPPGTVFECKVYVAPELEGGWSAVAATLPGVASQGRSFPEAVDNVREALAAAITEYRARGEDVPWAEAAGPDDPAAWECWVWVKVGG